MNDVVNARLISHRMKRATVVDKSYRRSRNSLSRRSEFRAGVRECAGVWLAQGPIWLPFCETGADTSADGHRTRRRAQRALASRRQRNCSCHRALDLSDRMKGVG